MHQFPLSTRFVLASFFVVGANLMASSGPRYEIAFASFGPVNAEIFLADASGNNAEPLLPHAGFDGNASFSRDGAWVVFTSERGGSYDIYRAHPDGTALERLVDDPAYDDQATLSPDGKSLAFVSSRSGQADIWILELATRKVRNLSNHAGGDFRPAWSPDGQWIAFTSDRDSKKPKDASRFGETQATEIYIVRADGSKMRRVTQTQTVAGSPTWSTDGKRLIFYEAELVESGNITSIHRRRGIAQISTIDLATNERRVLTTGSGEKWSPHWLDRDRIAYISGGPEGGVEFVTDSAVPFDKRGSGARGEFKCPSWSNDGRMVFHRDVDSAWPPFQKWHSRDREFALVRTGVFPAYAPAGGLLLCNDQPGAAVSKDIVAMNREGWERSIFFRGGEKSALAAVWSPGGEKVALAVGRFFQMQAGVPAIADIVVVNRDGTGAKTLTDGSGNFGFPSWSGDGSQIVYRSSGKESRGLFVMTLATGEVRALTPDSSNDNFPSWSPKGDRIAFTRYRDSNYDIYTVRPDGTDVRRLTEAPGNDAHSAWSPDGEWISFASARGGFKDEAALHPYNPQPYGDIYIMRADGSDVRQLTDTPFEEGTAAWAPIRSGLR